MYKLTTCNPRQWLGLSFLGDLVSICPARFLSFAVTDLASIHFGVRSYACLLYVFCVCIRIYRLGALMDFQMCSHTNEVSMVLLPYRASGVVLTIWAVHRSGSFVSRVWIEGSLSVCVLLCDMYCWDFYRDLRNIVETWRDC
jgi:hypothetical protein